MVANQTASNPVHVSIGRPNSTDKTFSGAAAIGGWALDDNAAISKVTVSVDGVPLGNAAYGGNRPDVCAVYPNRQGCPNVGWSFVMDTTMLADGDHKLSITAYGADGHYSTNSAAFTVTNGATTGALHLTLDTPNPQSEALVGGSSIEGWALNANAAISSVSVYVDGVLQGAATYGIARSDVCAANTGIGCPDVGWSFLLDTTKIADGPHMLEILAASGDGDHASTSVPVTVANWTTANPMRVSIGSPSAANNTLTGTAIIGGWAIDDLAAITQIAISVDGVFIGNASYGGSRPDVCSAYPNRPGCPNVGWGMLLDTTVLADGSHTLQVAATAASGQTTAAAKTFQVQNLKGRGPLYITIDWPRPSAPLSGTVIFSGWALDTGEAVANVSFSIDGMTPATTTPSARPDVCAAWGNVPGCPNLGWTYSVDTTALANGTHLLSVTATTVSGARETRGSSFQIEN
jgi:hypothetical protein